MHSIQAKLALLFQRKQDHRLSLEIFIKEQIQELEANQQHRTARAYRSVLNSFSGFLGSDDFQLQNLDDSVVKRFETYLKKNGKSLNTVSFYMRNLRAVYNKACKKQLIIHSYINPFEDTFTGIDKTSKRAVKQNIIKRLFNLDLSHNRDLEFSKRLFLFSFYTRGMSFVDMSFLLSLIHI